MKVGDMTWERFFSLLRSAGLGDVRGPYADDAAADADGVSYLSPYYQTDGALHLNLTAPASTYLRPGGSDGYFRPDGTSLYLRP